MLTPAFQRLRILLASCEVGLKEYAASQKTLQAVFAPVSGDQWCISRPPSFITISA